MQKALGTTLNRYRHDGTTVRANTGAVTLPTSVASYVTTVTGLDTTPHKVTHDAKKAAPFPDGFRNARPCSASYGDTPATAKADGTTSLPKFNGKTLPYAVCGYTGPQLRGGLRGRHRPHRRPGHDRRDHRRLRVADDRLRRATPTRSARRRRLRPPAS